MPDAAPEAIPAQIFMDQAAVSLEPGFSGSVTEDGQGSGETTTLASGPGGFQVLRSMVEVHTDEVI